MAFTWGSQTIGTAPAAPAAPSGSTDYASLIQQAAQSLNLNPQDPTANQQIASWLQQHGVPASVIQGPNGPSDHKLFINGQAWSDISSNNYQPGTYRIDPYQQVAYNPAMGAIDPKTGMPANPNWSGGAGPLGLPGSSPLQTLENIPGFQFTEQQGQKAIENSAFAHGTGLTGGTEKALDMFGQGVASQYYQDYVNNLLNASGLGQRAGTVAGDYTTQAGNAQAAGTVGSANAQNAMVGNLGNIAQQWWASRNPNLNTPLNPTGTVGGGYYDANGTLVPGPTQ